MFLILEISADSLTQTFFSVFWFLFIFLSRDMNQTIESNMAECIIQHFHWDAKIINDTNPESYQSK